MNLAIRTVIGLSSVIGAVAICCLYTSTGLATTQHVICSSPEKHSHSCNQCGRACHNCTTFGKCGDPQDSGACLDPEFNGISRACDETSNEFCPGPGVIYNTLNGCEWEIPEEIIASSSQTCLIATYEYSKAVSVQTQNNCLE